MSILEPIKPVKPAVGIFSRLGASLDRQWVKPGWGLPVYLAGLVFCFVLGPILLYSIDVLPIQWIGWIFLALGEIGLFLGFMEFVVLRALGLFRLGALVRVTYYEALLQPFTIIVLVVGWACILAGSYMPFFTLSEDTKMYRDVATQFVLLFPLVIMVFAAGKVIDEEIENRTMLTLMSKPIARWQVIVGKYLGVVCLVMVAVVVLGIGAVTFANVRFYDDNRIDLMVARNSSVETQRLIWENHKAIVSLVPLMALEFLQVATLASISVAISTRFGLALNMTVVALLYVGANLTRNVHDLGLESHLQWVLDHAAHLLPFLANFDLSPVLIYGNIGYSDSVLNMSLSAQIWQCITVVLWPIWQYVAMTGVYSLLYIGAALSIAVALFRTRELT